MALSAITELKIGKIGIWELTESVSSLTLLYNPAEKEKNELTKLNNKKKKKEYLAIRLLLKHILPGNNEIVYNEKRKPYLKNKKLNISISHSKDLAVLMISNKNIGIDVEPASRQVDKVASRVLNDRELADSSTDSLKQLLYWCAKEAAFKTVPGENINFKNNIEINPFILEPTGGLFFGRFLKNSSCKNLSFTYFFHKNNIIVYCVI